MSQEDFVQNCDVFYFSGNVTSAALTAAVQRGRGSLERTGVGAIRWNLPSGQGVDPNLINFRYQDSDAGNPPLSMVYDKAGSTPEQHNFSVVDNAAAATDPGEFALFISTVQ